MAHTTTKKPNPRRILTADARRSTQIRHPLRSTPHVSYEQYRNGKYRAMLCGIELIEKTIGAVKGSVTNV